MLMHSGMTLCAIYEKRMVSQLHNNRLSAITAKLVQFAPLFCISEHYIGFNSEEFPFINFLAHIVHTASNPLFLSIQVILMKLCRKFAV